MSRSRSGLDLRWPTMEIPRVERPARFDLPGLLRALVIGRAPIQRNHDLASSPDFERCGLRKGGGGPPKGACPCPICTRERWSPPWHKRERAFQVQVYHCTADGCWTPINMEAYWHELGAVVSF